MPTMRNECTLEIKQANAQLSHVMKRTASHIWHFSLISVPST